MVALVSVYMSMLVQEGIISWDAHVWTLDGGGLFPRSDKGNPHNVIEYIS